MKRPIESLQPIWIAAFSIATLSVGCTLDPRPIELPFEDNSSPSARDGSAVTGSEMSDAPAETDSRPNSDSGDPNCDINARLSSCGDYAAESAESPQNPELLDAGVPPQDAAAPTADVGESVAVDAGRAEAFNSDAGVGLEELDGGAAGNSSN